MRVALGVEAKCDPHLPNSGDKSLTINFVAAYGVLIPQACAFLHNRLSPKLGCCVTGGEDDLLPTVADRCLLALIGSLRSTNWAKMPVCQGCREIFFRSEAGSHSAFDGRLPHQLKFPSTEHSSKHGQFDQSKCRRTTAANIGSFGMTSCVPMPP